MGAFYIRNDIHELFKKKHRKKPQICNCLSEKSHGSIGDEPISEEKIESKGDTEENMLPNDRVRPAEKCQNKNVRHGKCKDCKIDVEICDKNCEKYHDCKRPMMSNGRCLQCGMRARDCCC